MSNDLRVLSGGELDVASDGEHLIPVVGSVTPIPARAQAWFGEPSEPSCPPSAKLSQLSGKWSEAGSDYVRSKFG
jgi:hypothetical protein